MVGYFMVIRKLNKFKIEVNTGIPNEFLVLMNFLIDMKKI